MNGILESLPEGTKLDTESLRTAHYVDELSSKNCIVLHQTEGRSARSSFEWLESQYSTVMVAFFVDRDGTVFQTYPADRWAYHLGKGVPTFLNKDSIAIEIANLGALVRSGDDLVDDVAKRRICSIDEVDRYYKVDPPYRGVSYFEANPDAQLSAVRCLIDQLCREFGIPKAFCPDPWTYDSKFRSRKFKGIYHHAKVRTDKVDLHPGFPIDRLGL